MSWKRHSINQSFQWNLWCTFRKKYFTTKQAEDLYIKEHMFKTSWSGRTQDTYWPSVSARNSISAAVFHGELRRVRKGVYVFVRRPKGPSTSYIKRMIKAGIWSSDCVPR